MQRGSIRTCLVNDWTVFKYCWVTCVACGRARKSRRRIDDRGRVSDAWAHSWQTRQCRSRSIEPKHYVAVSDVAVSDFAVYACHLANFVIRLDMPRCDPDRSLQRLVLRFISENGLTTSGAAGILGVDRTTFWRFCDTGKARADTRALYNKVLEKYNKTRVADVANAAVLVVVGRDLPRVLHDRELKQIRRVFEGVVALLDAYEAVSLARDDEVAL